MTPKNLKALAIAAALTLVITITLHINPYHDYTLLDHFNENTYTFYLTSATVTETIIKHGDNYLFVSDTQTYVFYGPNYAEQYIPDGATTIIKRYYLIKPFNQCNLADPLVSGTIIFPTGTSFTQPINMKGLYIFACYVLSSAHGQGTLTVTITGTTLIASIPGQSITFTLLG